MKNTFKKVAAIALAVLMCVTAAVPAFATTENACPGVGELHTIYNCTATKKTEKAASCDVAGSITYQCNTCYKTFVESVPALGHDYDAVVTDCVAGTTRTCKVCKYVDVIAVPTGHTWTEWVIANNGVCAAFARVTRTCVDCGEEEKSTIPVEGHMFELVSYTMPATCVSTGKATFQCKVSGCGFIKEAPITLEGAKELLGDFDLDLHTYINWATALEMGLVEGKDPYFVAPTCKTAGAETYICALCGYATIVDIVKLPHTLATNDGAVVTVPKVDATCTTTGKLAYQYCIECGQKQINGADKTDAQLVIKSFHDASNTNNTTYIDTYLLPTCTTDGYKIVKCTECDLNETVVIKALGAHQYIDSWTAQTGYDVPLTLQGAVYALKALKYNSLPAADRYSTKPNATNPTWNGASAQWKSSSTIIAAPDATALEKGHDTYTSYGVSWTNYVAATCTTKAKVTQLCINYYCLEDISKAQNVTIKTYNATTGALDTTTVGAANYAAADRVFVCGQTYGEATGKVVELTNAKYKALDHSWTKNADKTAVNTDADGYYEAPVATCTTAGIGVYTCLRNCGTTKTETVAALGHDTYSNPKVAQTRDDSVTLADVTDGELIDSIDEKKTPISYYNTVTNLDTATEKTCKDFGIYVEFCTRCPYTPAVLDNPDTTDVNEAAPATGYIREYTKESTGAEHVWVYVDVASNKNPTCVDLGSVTKYCQICGDAPKAYAIDAKGHDYADVSKIDFAKEFKNAAIGTTKTLQGGAVTYVQAGNCIQGAKYKLQCNECNMFDYHFETEGFVTGHNKVYLGGTARAAKCTTAGNSAKWYCTNKICEYYYASFDAAFDANNGIDTTAGKTEKNWDVTYLPTHNLADVKYPATGVVATYKDVPDEAISGAETIAKAQLVKATDKKAVAIPGTSLLWVYVYEAADKCAEDTVTRGGFYCVDCADGGAAAFGSAAAQITRAANHTNAGVSTFVSGAQQTANCRQVGYTLETCTQCFKSVVADFSYETAHNYDADPNTIGIQYYHETLVPATCDMDGYHVYTCVVCAYENTVVLPALGHNLVQGGDKVNNPSTVLTESCLNAHTNRVCATCKLVIAKKHDFGTGTVCKQCGATA